MAALFSLSVFALALTACGGDPCRARHRENMEACHVAEEGPQRVACGVSAQEAYKACRLNEGDER